MNSISDIQKAIHYMEDHLMEDVHYDDVADYLNLSNYHFHRTFSMITGITPNEYIRNRRLSMAGQEMIFSDLKVIDLAYKYMYESPESFSKAFTRFHGVSPSIAKKSGMRLTIFNPLVMKIKMVGGSMMQYKIVKKEPFQLIAKVEHFPNESINDPEKDTNEIAAFWDKSYDTGVVKELSKHALAGDMYGVCGPVSKESDYFDYGIGMLHDGSEVPEGFQLWKVKPTTWAVFSCIGENPNCISETWDRIFKEFLPGSGYSMLDDTDFELYPEKKEQDVFCEIWIPVAKNS